MTPSLNYRRGRSGRPITRRKAEVYATETHCCICKKPVDKTRPYRDPRTGKPDPLSKSIEHPDIEGDPYDVHLAHLGCNTRAGASKGGRIIAARKRAAPQITSSPGWT